MCMQSGGCNDNYMQNIPDIPVETDMAEYIEYIKSN